MSEFAADPVFQTAIAPLLIGTVATGLLRFGGGPVAGRRLAAGGIGVAFLLCFLLILGLPMFPPPSAMGKVFWSIGAGLAVCAGADLVGLGARPARRLVALWLGASLVWIASPLLASGGIDATAAFRLLALAVIAVTALRPGVAEAGEAATPAVILLFLAASVGGVAMIGASASVAQLAFALAAAVGGFMLWNWPVGRHAWGATGQLATGIALLLIGVLTLFSTARTELLLVVVPALLADRLRDRLPWAETASGRALSTLALALFAAVPAATAVTIAHLLSTGGEVPSGY